jgi:hypothetical protein
LPNAGRSQGCRSRAKAGSFYASSDDLTAWVGTERGQQEPVHIASESEDLLGDLKQGLSYVRKQKKIRSSRVKQFSRKVQDCASDIYRQTATPMASPPQITYQHGIESAVL